MRAEAHSAPQKEEAQEGDRGGAGVPTEEDALAYGRALHSASEN